MRVIWNKFIDYLKRHKAIVVPVLVVLILLCMAGNAFAFVIDEYFKNGIVAGWLQVLFLFLPMGLWGLWLAISSEGTRENILLIVVAPVCFFAIFLPGDRYMQKASLNSESVWKIAVVRAKESERGGHRRSRHSYYYLDNEKGWHSCVPSFYSSIKEGDTLIVRRSVRYPKVMDVVKVKPSHYEIEKYKVPQLLIDGETQPKPPYNAFTEGHTAELLRKSHRAVGRVYEKLDDEYYRHIVRVGVDSAHTTGHEFEETDWRYAKIYKRIEVGDRVILDVSDVATEVNRVVCWQPTEEDIAGMEEYEVVKDCSDFLPNREKGYMHESHKRTGVVYDKYRDTKVGAYLEVGIDRHHVRTHVFRTFDKKEMETYKKVEVGDTVIVRVSDRLPQLNSVMTWKPTREEIEKYRQPVKLVEKNW